VVLAVLAALVVAAPPAHALVQADTGKGDITFTGNAGLVSTSGNTNNTSINVGDKIVGHTDGWTFTQLFSLVYGKNDSVVTASLWRASVRGARAIARRASLFVIAAFDRDSFAGISSRYTPQVGIAAAIVAAPHDTLNFELGATYTWLNAFRPDTARTSGGARVAASYQHLLSARSIISEAIEYLPNLKDGHDYRINSETDIVAPITAGIAMRAGYTIRYDALPVDDHKTTDRILTTGIQVTF
jgi:putative salt-induced outer membrane protein